MKNAIKKCIGVAARGLAKVGLLPRVIILNCDGGICSQMHFYLVGRMLEKRGQKVVYNIEWFEKCGKDIDGRFSRNFDLLKMFPELDFKVQKNRIVRFIYRHCLNHWNDYGDMDTQFAWTKLKAPLLLEGYFRDPDEMFGPLFDETFQVNVGLLNQDNIEFLNRIEESERRGGACAIHVRRGDLSKYNEAYGYPVPVDYFVESSKRILQECPGVKFYIFSDEPEWCRENVLPHLQVDAEICDINGSDRGYCDLILMSRCRHQISSQGSMGRYAARLRPKERRNGIVITSPRY